MVIVIIATALQTARNAGQKKACGKTFGRFGYLGENLAWGNGVIGAKGVLLLTEFMMSL